MDKLIEKLLPLLTEWKTRKGYFVVISMIFLVIFFYLKIPLTLFSSLGYIIVFLLWTFIWYIGSSRVIIPLSNKKTVVFSFNVDAEGKRNYSRILIDLSHKLEELQLSSRIRIINAAPDLISNTQQATKYRENKKVDIVVWGKSFYGNLNEKKVLKFEVNHTCVVSEGLKQKPQLFFSDLAVILQRRKWTVDELNELADVKIVADDFLETCLFIIGIYYYDEKSLDDAICVFEAILPTLKAKAIDTEDNFRIIQEGRVNAMLTELYFLKAQIADSSGDHPTAVFLLSKILLYVPNKIPVLINLARSYYLSGDFSNAQKCTKEMRQIDKKHPGIFLNNAFFGIIQKNYERVRFWYDEILKLTSIRDIDLFSVITFLDDEYKKYPAEHCFLYAFGIVNGYIDPNRRKIDLRRFLKLTKDRPEYEVLRRRAKELLGNIKSQ